MTAEQNITCCTSLSGIYNESTNTCEMGNLGARKYNFTYPSSLEIFILNKSYNLLNSGGASGSCISISSLKN